MAGRVESGRIGASYSRIGAPDEGPCRTNAAPPRIGARPKARERRQTLRYRAQMGRAWIGWREAGEFVTRASWVLDVSSGGCLLAAEGAPPAGTSAFLRLDGVVLPEWFPVQVLDVRDSMGTVGAVRLAFPEGCPYELFMGLAYGRFHGPKNST